MHAISLPFFGPTAVTLALACGACTTPLAPAAPASETTVAPVSPSSSDAGAVDGESPADAPSDDDASRPPFFDAAPPIATDANGGPSLGPDAAPAADAAPADPSPCPDVDSLLRGDCSGCHRAGSSLDLQTADIAHRLSGVDASQGGLLIDPGQPLQSVLYEKLTPSPPFGARMPLSLPPYDDARLACVAAWIAAL